MLLYTIYFMQIAGKHYHTKRWQEILVGIPR